MFSENLWKVDGSLLNVRKIAQRSKPNEPWKHFFQEILKNFPDSSGQMFRNLFLECAQDHF